MEYITVNIDKETNERVTALKQKMRIAKVDVIRLAVDKLFDELTPAVAVPPTTPTTQEQAQQ